MEPETILKYTTKAACVHNTLSGDTFVKLFEYVRDLDPGYIGCVRLHDGKAVKLNIADVEPVTTKAELARASAMKAARSRLELGVPLSRRCSYPSIGTFPMNEVASMLMLTSSAVRNNAKRFGMTVIDKRHLGGRNVGYLKAEDVCKLMDHFLPPDGYCSLEESKRITGLSADVLHAYSKTELLPCVRKGNASFYELAGLLEVRSRVVAGALSPKQALSMYAVRVVKLPKDSTLQDHLSALNKLGASSTTKVRVEYKD